MALTEIQIRNAVAKDKPYKLHDIEGLHLLVNPNGRMYWRMRYRFAKKSTTISFGRYPASNLLGAREKCLEAQKLINQQIDPVENRRQDKRQLHSQYENTFEVVVRDWIKVRGAHWQGREAQKTIRLMERDLFGPLGNRPISLIKPYELYSALKAAEKIKESRAYRAFKSSRRVFRYAVACGLVEYDITQCLIGTFKKPKRKPRPWINEDELPVFLQKLAAHGHAQTRRSLELLMLTFVRSSELCGATWNEFDIVRKEWHIPAERMKMRRKHIVPLSNQALGLIEQIRCINGRSKHLFPDSSKPAQPISGKALLRAMYDIMNYGDKATPHSIRATACTLLNENGFKSEHVEIQLSHLTVNRTQNGKYNYAYYLPERHQMMQWWADYLDEKRNIVEGSS